MGQPGPYGLARARPAKSGLAQPTFSTSLYFASLGRLQRVSELNGSARQLAFFFFDSLALHTVTLLRTARLLANPLMEKKGRTNLDLACPLTLHDWNRDEGRGERPTWKRKINFLLLWTKVKLCVVIRISSSEGRTLPPTGMNSLIRKAEIWDGRDGLADWEIWGSGFQIARGTK